MKWEKDSGMIYIGDGLANEVKEVSANDVEEGIANRILANHVEAKLEKQFEKQNWLGHMMMKALGRIVK